MQQYTVLSQQAYEYALFPSLTPKAAAEWVEHSGFFRTLPEKLERFYAGTPEEMKEAVRVGLLQNHASEKERESIRKNVNNWFTKRKGLDDRTISRNYAMEMCFILGFSLDQADAFLRSVNGEGIHYRNLREFVFSFALRHKMTYGEYSAFLQELTAMAETLPQREEPAQNYTRSSALAVKELQTREELSRYVQEHCAEFSSVHNTAYAYFMEMMEVLQNGGTRASVDALVTENLYRRLVKKSKGLSPIAKSIRAGWPDETYISRMKRRELEVTRKVLILLYLASGGEVSREDPWDPDGLDAFVLSDDALEDGTGDADFEGLRNQIDAMLVECGFTPLDPRTPFDWMVLFGIATGDLFDLDERFEDFLNTLFGNEMKE